MARRGGVTRRSDEAERRDGATCRSRGKSGRWGWSATPVSSPTPGIYRICILPVKLMILPFVRVERRSPTGTTPRRRPGPGRDPGSVAVDQSIVPVTGNDDWFIGAVVSATPAVPYNTASPSDGVVDAEQRFAQRIEKLDDVNVSLTDDDREFEAAIPREGVS